MGIPESGLGKLEKEENLSPLSNPGFRIGNSQ